MKNDEFDKLFKYMQEFRQEVDAKFERVDWRFDDLEKLVDNIN